MALKLLLVASIILQLIAAGIAISMIKQTKYNLSWILFTIALTIMAMSRMAEYMMIFYEKNTFLNTEMSVWVGVLTSLCFAVGILIVRKIFVYISRNEMELKVSAQRILNTIIRTEERERQRFSKELHDGLGPLLSSAKLSVSALSVREKDQKNRDIIANTAFVVDEAIRTLKEVTNNMSPHILNNFGLAVALRKFIESINSLTIKINYQTNIREQRFNTDVEIVFYRVACELINNSLKHSEASLINVILNVENSKLILCYTDNGKGFDTADTEFGIGLSNMESRISTIGGQFELSSSPHKGMNVKIEVTV